MELVGRRALSCLSRPRGFFPRFCSAAAVTPPGGGAAHLKDKVIGNGEGESACAAVERLDARLREAGVPEPELSSRYLVSQALGGRRHDDYLTGGAERRLNTAEALELSRLLNCRLARMPLQYIAGNWDFRGITLLTRPPVFIPRQAVTPHPHPTKMLSQIRACD